MPDHPIFAPSVVKLIRNAKLAMEEVERALANTPQMNQLPREARDIVLESALREYSVYMDKGQKRPSLEIFLSVNTLNYLAEIKYISDAVMTYLNTTEPQGSILGNRHSAFLQEARNRPDLLERSAAFEILKLGTPFTNKDCFKLFILRLKDKLEYKKIIELHYPNEKEETIRKRYSRCLQNLLENVYQIFKKINRP